MKSQIAFDHRSHVAPDGGCAHRFDRLVQADGKVVLYDVPFNSMTFEHHLEHRVQSLLPIPLYRPEPMSASVIDYDGNLRNVSTLILNSAIHAIRDSTILERQLTSSGILKHVTVGRSQIAGAIARQMLSFVTQPTASGKVFHH